MGNTSSERAGLERQGEKGHRRGTKDGERPKILMDSPEDADIFHGEDMKAPLEKEEFLAWRQDLEVSDKAPTQARPTVFRWTGAGKDVFVSGSFNNWVSKIPLTRSQNNFVAIVDLPEGEHQYKFYVDGQWTHDPSEPVVTNQLGTVNNLIQVKKTDFEVFDALLVDSLKSSDVSGKGCTPVYLYSLSIKGRAAPVYLHTCTPCPSGEGLHTCRAGPVFIVGPVPLVGQLLCASQDGVMVLSATHRYKKKFVTTLLYKPI
uniref:5'-AMP-activated protein kinase subunit beta-1 n=1 Tax=Lepisosteus oculatus TaxID=7918 RepID=W5M045_LEPOC